MQASKLKRKKIVIMSGRNADPRTQEEPVGKHDA